MEFNGHELIITYKKIKRINARIRDNRILVSAPFYTKEETIFNFLNDNKNRIEKIFLNQVNTDSNIMYVWGMKYEIIKIESKDNKVLLIDDKAYVSYKKDYLDSIDKFYKEETLKELKEVIYKYKELMIK